MAHIPGHIEDRPRQNVLIPSLRFNVNVSARAADPSTQIGHREKEIGDTFRAFQAASKKRRQRFRETRGLFTTGLNLSRLRALSSIR